MLVGCLVLTFAVGLYVAQYRWFAVQCPGKLEARRLSLSLLGAQLLGVTGTLVLVGLPWLLRDQPPWRAPAWYVAHTLLQCAQQAFSLFLLYSHAVGHLHPKLACLATAIALQLLSLAAAAGGLALPNAEWLAAGHLALGPLCWAAQEFRRSGFTAFTVDVLLPVGHQRAEQPLNPEGEDPFHQFLGLFANARPAAAPSGRRTD
eukprot:EG_transcript_22473